MAPFVVLGFLLGSAPIVRADEVVAAAKREQARREALRKKREKHGKQGDEVKVLSNTDLRVAGAGASVSEVTPHQETKAATPAAGAGAQSPEQAQEALWRGRLEAAQSDVAAARRKVADLQADLAEARRQAANIDDPNLRLQAGQRMRELESTGIPAAEQAVRDAEKAVEDLREQARREGVPPGFLR
jgi:hypothetical protein